MTTNTKDLSNLKEQDLYSIILYAIYRCTGDEKYSTISELIYTLNKDGLLNLCSIFGGSTIRIPTLAELKLYTNALLVYQLMLEGKTFDEAYKETGLKKEHKIEVAKIYSEISNILSNYDW